jgi:type I restriction enzyme S subunit
VHLEEIVDILDRMRIPINSDERSKRQGDIPYYGATGQVGWIDDFVFNEEFVLLGEDGAPFLDSNKPKAYIIKGKSWVNNHAHVLKALGGVPNTFVMHQLNVLDYQPYVSGTTRLKLPQGPMKQIPILLPPLPEQHRIVEAIESYLTRLDDAIASLERALVNLKRYRASVLKAAVEGRLVPTEAELARKEGRDYEPASVLLERILAERKQRFIEEEAEKERDKEEAKARDKGKPWTQKDDAKTLQKGREKAEAKYQEPQAPDTSELPDLPEGWCWATVEQLVWDSSYGTSQKCDYEAKGPAVLRIPNIQSQSVTLDDLKFALDGTSLKKSEMLKKGDFLFIRTNGSPNLIGRGAPVAISLPRECYFASYLIRLRLVSIEPLLEWFSLAWHSQVVREQISQEAASSAGQFNVSQTAAKRFTIPIPPVEEQQRALAHFNQLRSNDDNTEQTISANIARCQRLRQSILKWAFEGRLVDQDPEDESASVLLERIRAERKGQASTSAVKEASPAKKRGRKKKTEA